MEEIKGVEKTGWGRRKREEEANGNKREGNTVDVLSVLSVGSGGGEKMRVELDVCGGRIWYDCIT